MLGWEKTLPTTIGTRFLTLPGGIMVLFVCNQVAKYMNKTKLFFSFLLLVCGVTYANSQSGAAQLRVFVHAGRIGNSDVGLKNVKVIMRPIEAWNKNMKTVEAESENNGYYKTGVSFGEYELTVSADNFQTYRAIVYLPASSSFTCGVRLHEVEKIPQKQKSNTDK